jgi:integrase
MKGIRRPVRPGNRVVLRYSDTTRALPQASIERLLSRRDIPLRGKTLWRMLYETAARASEILALNVEDLDLERRRAPTSGPYSVVHPRKT